MPEAVAIPVNEHYTNNLRSVSSGENSQEAITHPQNDKAVASGVTGAVLGFLFGGPILSALLGFGAAYLSKKDGAPGDAARALGDVGISVKEKAVEVDEKHHIVEKSTTVAANALDEAKKYDQKHHLIDSTKDFAVANWKSFTKFIHEHRILQKGVDGFGVGYEFVTEKIASCAGTATTAPTLTKMEE